MPAAGEAAAASSATDGEPTLPASRRRPQPAAWPPRRGPRERGGAASAVDRDSRRRCRCRRPVTPAKRRRRSAPLRPSARTGRSREAGEVFADVLSGAYDDETDRAEAAEPAAAPPKRVLAAEPDAPKLHKVLAQAGIGSRRDMEQLIVEGRITVNGEPAHIGQRISFGDRIERRRQADPGAHRAAAAARAGLSQAGRRGGHARRPAAAPHGVPPPAAAAAGQVAVGGPARHQHRRPAAVHQLGRTGQPADAPALRRRARVRGARARRCSTRPKRERLLQGVEIDGQTAAFKSIEDGGGEGANHWYRVVITEGRNREVRKLFEAVGHAVSRLIRIRYGSVVLPRGLQARCLGRPRRGRRARRCAAWPAARAREPTRHADGDAAPRPRPPQRACRRRAARPRAAAASGRTIGAASGGRAPAARASRRDPSTRPERGPRPDARLEPWRRRRRSPTRCSRPSTSAPSSRRVAQREITEDGADPQPAAADLRQARASSRSARAARDQRGRPDPQPAAADLRQALRRKGARGRRLRPGRRRRRLAVARRSRRRPRPARPDADRGGLHRCRCLHAASRRRAAVARPGRGKPRRAAAAVAAAAAAAAGRAAAPARLRGRPAGLQSKALPSH